MQIIRLAILPVEDTAVSNLPMTHDVLRISKGDITIGFAPESLTIEGQKNLVLIAQKPLKHRPKVTSEGLAVVPDRLWRDLERELENISNAFALASGRPHSLSSPEPCIALQHDNDEEKEWLSKIAGIKTPGPQFEVGLAAFDINIWQNLPHLADREEGMAMLSDALRQSKAGKFRECWRLFERAFAKAGKSIVDPLSAFLGGNYMNYDRSEVETWVKTRDMMTHADQSSTVLLERDIGHVAHRVLQAGYDVLFNKAKWRDSDSSRRDVWFPGCGLTNRPSMTFVHRGSALQMPFSWVDDFRAFPVHLQVSLPTFPENWWPKSGPRREINSEGAIGLEVKESLEDLGHPSPQHWVPAASVKRDESVGQTDQQ